MLAQDIAANDETPISEETVASYVSALRKIFVVEDMPAWNPNLRSKTAIRTSDTRYYIDPSTLAAIRPGIPGTPDGRYLNWILHQSPTHRKIPNLRSKTAIRTSDTRYYIDPSIAAAALGVGPNDKRCFSFIFCVAESVL